jgi:hypothetical protein
MKGGALPFSCRFVTLYATLAVAGYVVAGIASSFPDRASSIWPAGEIGDCSRLFGREEIGSVFVPLV